MVPCGMGRCPVSGQGRDGEWIANALISGRGRLKHPGAEQYPPRSGISGEKRKEVSLTSAFVYI